MIDVKRRRKNASYFVGCRLSARVQFTQLTQPSKEYDVEPRRFIERNTAPDSDHFLGCNVRAKRFCVMRWTRSSVPCGRDQWLHGRM